MHRSWIDVILVALKVAIWTLAALAFISILFVIK